MSRSRKKQPFAPIAADSDKPFKQRVSRAVRRVSKERLGATLDGDSLPVRNELVNPWDSNKESKVRVDDPKSKRLRK